VACHAHFASAANQRRRRSAATRRGRDAHLYRLLRLPPVSDRAWAAMGVRNHRCPAARSSDGLRGNSSAMGGGHRRRCGIRRCGRWDAALEDMAAVEDAAVDNPEKAHEAVPVRALSLNAGIGLAAVAVQTGIESGVALWGFTFLTEAVGVSPVIAGGLASGYWVAMFVGRIVLGSLAERIGSWRVMGLAVSGMVVAAALAIAATPSAATTAMLLFGLSTAPMYPLLVLTTAERTSAAVADRLIGFQAAASALGAAVIPLLIGLAMGVSAGAFALAIAPLSLTAALLYIAMQMHRRR
jgi:fucose permease